MLIRFGPLVVSPFLAFSVAAAQQPQAPISGSDGMLSPEKVEELYTDACEAGDASACSVFAVMKETGGGVEQDLPRAAALYRRACEGGVLSACTRVGLMYESGIGVEANLIRAVGFYEVACDGGDPQGCGALEALRAGTASDSTTHAKAGRVGDADTGEALQQALITLPDLGITAVSDSAGGFVLRGVPEGEHRIAAERVGYQVLEGEVEVPRDQELVLLMSPISGGDPSEPGRIVGRVADENDGGSLSAVEVLVGEGGRASTVTNAQGRFLLNNVQPGLFELRFIRLGYAPRTATVVVQPGRTVEVSATMATEPVELDPIEVTVRSRFLEDNGFYRRAEQSRGAHFTPQDLDLIDPVELADVMRRVPGVRVQYGQDGFQQRAVSNRSVSVSGGSCVLPVYVDGVRMSDSDLGQISPDWIEALEVYDGINMPVQFQSDLNACGAVVVWTGGGSSQREH